MAEINLDRRGRLDWDIVRGDTFAPPPVEFLIDDVPEDFSNSTLRMQIRKNGALIKELTEGAGISIQDNILQYSIDATEMAQLSPGFYEYDVQKTTEGIVTTIQFGKIKLIQDETI